MLFLIANATLALACWRGARALVQPAWLRLAVGLGLFQLLAVAGALVAGVSGFMSPTATVLWGVLAALFSVPLKAKPTEDAGWAREANLGLALLGGTLALWAARLGFDGSRFNNDDAIYHAALPAAWLTEGALHVVPFTYQTYYPLGAELLTFWFLLTTGEFTHVSLAPLLHGLTLAAGGMAVAERMDWDRGLTAGLLATLLISKRVVQVADGTTAPDLAATATLLVVVALVLRSAQTRSLGLAGALAGLALSIKVTVGLPLLVLLGWVAHERRSLRAMLSFAVPLLVFGSPFYLHNLLLTGNPLFPAELLFFDGPFERSAQALTSLRPFLLSEPLEVLRTRLNWPLPLGLTVLLGMFGGLVVGVKYREPERVLLAFLALLGLLILPLQPFSGTINRPDQPLHNLIRHLLPTVALSLAALGWRDPHRSVHGVVAVLWGSVFALAWSTTPTIEIAVVVVAILIIGAGLLLGAHHHRVLVPALLFLTLFGIAARTPAKRRTAIRGLATGSRTALWQQELSMAVNKLPRGSRIAQVAEVPVEVDQSVRPYGALLQHRYLAIDVDGTPLRPLHERWRDEPAPWFWRWETDVTADFLHNLKQTDADYLLISRCATSKRWNHARRQLLTTRPANRLHRSRCGEIWALGTQDGRPTKGSSAR